jgi:HAE1 family hydrophobic/amphiphilic exporter-1
VALVASAAYPIGNLRETEAGVGNPNDFQLHANFSPAMTWDERKDWLSEAEEALSGRSEALGLSDALIRLPRDSGRARLRVFLKPPGERPAGMDRQEIAAAAQAALPAHPGVEVSARWAQEEGEDRIVEVHLSRPDSDRLALVGEDVSARLRGVPGVLSVRAKDEEEVVTELQLRVQRDMAARQGLSPLLVGGSVDFALRGRRLRDLHEPHGQTPIVALAPEEAREDLEDLDRVTLPDPAGGPGVGLPALTRRSYAPSWPSLQRLNRRTTLTLEVESQAEDLKALGEQIDGALARYAFPRGYALSKGERFKRLQTNDDERGFALGLAIVCVFLLMGVLFESFVLPLSILASIPFAFVGVYWTLYLTDTSFDVMAGVGMVILVGVVVNNAVVLVDQVGSLRASGLARRAALVEAGRKRLRPILMTALTTIFGLIPMATGSASLVGIPYAPLGRTLIGGMVASTVLTLFLVPLCYTLFDDLREGVWALVTGRPRARGGDV